jgi:hypothetical protein
MPLVSVAIALYVIGVYVNARHIDIFSVVYQLVWIGAVLLPGTIIAFYLLLAHQERSYWKTISELLTLPVSLITLYPRSCIVIGLTAGIAFLIVAIRSPAAAWILLVAIAVAILLLWSYIIIAVTLAWLPAAAVWGVTRSANDEKSQGATRTNNPRRRRGSP